MSFNIGDTVRVGKRGVECQVTGPGSGEGFYMIKSAKTHRDVHGDKLVLVKAAEPVPEVPEIDANDHRYSSYGRAILAGLQGKAHVFQGLINPNKKRSARVTRRARKLTKNKKG